MRRSDPIFTDAERKRAESIDTALHLIIVVAAVIAAYVLGSMR